MYGYIYKTTNKINNKIYIGQKHSGIFLGDKYLGSGKRLKEAINKYGKKSFTVELLECVEKETDMDSREIYWIKKYNATNKDIGYNLSEGGLVNRTLVGENNPFYGKHHSDELRKKISERSKSRVGLIHKTKEQKEHMHYKLLGRKITWGDKISQNAKVNPNYGTRGKEVSKETRKRLSESMLKMWCNMPESEKERKRKATISQWQDPEYRRKHIEGMVGKKKNINKTFCVFCGKSVSLGNIKRHVDSAHLNKKN